jgi:hypothetical protein
LHSRHCDSRLVTTLREACDSLHSRSFDLVLSSNRLPDGAGFHLIEFLAGFPTSLFIFHPVEDNCIWFPAIVHGIKCWGSGALKPKAFVRLIDEIIADNQAGREQKRHYEENIHRNHLWGDKHFDKKENGI